MFRFFRHHSWILIATLSLTIISFVVFMAKAPLHSGSGMAGGDYGTIYGQVITPTQFEETKRSFFITYWEQSGEWPDKGGQISDNELEQEVYSYLLLDLKAKELGIHVNDDAVATAANDLLRSPALMRMFGTSQPVPATAFIQQVLMPEHLTAVDFQRAVRTRIMINQLVNLLGLPGALITPAEAETMYDRENQEVSAQVVFFSASNYLSQTSLNPVALGQFFTNNMAAYRLPDRVQINYVAFYASNFAAQAKSEWAKTNFEDTVGAIYDRYATTQFANEKSPEAAKAEAKIREMLVNRRALQDANVEANNFVSELYAMNPVQPDNLATLARQKNLPVQLSAPFDAETGPEDFEAPSDLAKVAFQLNADSPYNGPIVGADAVYVIALARQLPSMIPDFESIRNQVAHDFQTDQAIALAQRSGTNFYYSAQVLVSLKKSFADVAAKNHLGAVTLPPFSLSTSDLPELDGHAELDQVKRAAFTTPPGRLSPFVSTADGGFVLYVQSILPLDQNKKAAEFPKFLQQVRRSRLNEAFNLWLNNEMNRELQNTPYFKQLQASAGH